MSEQEWPPFVYDYRAPKIPSTPPRDPNWQPFDHTCPDDARGPADRTEPAIPDGGMTGQADTPQTPAKGKRIEWVQQTPEEVAEYEARQAKYIADTDECPECHGYGMVMSWGGPTDCMNGCYQGRVERVSR